MAVVRVTGFDDEAMTVTCTNVILVVGTVPLSSSCHVGLGTAGLV